MPPKAGSENTAWRELLRALVPGGGDLTEAQLASTKSPKTRGLMQDVLRDYLNRLATAKGWKVPTGGVPGAGGDTGAGNIAYWQRILDSKQFAEKEGGVGGVAFVRKAARAVLDRLTPGELENSISAYLSSEGLSPATRVSGQKNAPNLAELVKGVIDDPERLPEAEKAVGKMFPVLKKETIAGKTYGAQSKGKAAALKTKALRVLQKAAADQGVPKPGPGGYTGKILPGVPQTSVGEGDAAEAMARVPAKPLPARAGSGRKPTAKMSKEQVRRDTIVKGVYPTAKTSASSEARVRALATLDKLTGKAGKAPAKGAPAKGATIDPRVLAALGIPAAVAAQIASGGKAATAAAASGGKNMSPINAKGLLAQYPPILRAAGTIKAAKAGSLARGMETMPKGPRGLAGAMAAASTKGLGALGMPSGGFPSPAAEPAAKGFLEKLLTGKGLGMMGGALILGLLVSHLMERSQAPANVRLAGRLQAAQTPPPELMAQRGQMGQQMGQQQMLSQMLAAQSMGGGQRMSPYETGR